MCRCRWGIWRPRLYGLQVGQRVDGSRQSEESGARDEGPLWRAVRIRRGLAGNDPYRSASCERLLPDKVVNESLRQASGVGVMRQVSAGMPVMLRFAGVGRPGPGHDNESASLYTCAWGIIRPLYGRLIATARHLGGTVDRANKRPPHSLVSTQPRTVCPAPLPPSPSFWPRPSTAQLPASCDLALGFSCNRPT